MRATVCKLAYLAALAGCGSIDSGGEPGMSRDWLGAAVSIPTSPELAEIAQLEYERSTGGKRLIELLSHAEAAIRLRATVALGRLPFPEFGAEVTEPLVRALDDADPAVRREAAFALGQRGDASAGGVLAVYRNDADPRLRARVAEASRNLDHDGLRDEVLRALQDADLEVRICAILAIARWDPEAARAAAADAALLLVLRPSGAPGPGREVQPELRWRTLYALQRRRSEGGRAAFLEFAGAPIALERIYAVRGLANLRPDDPSLVALSRAAEDGDWRVAAEAVVGLGRSGNATVIPALVGGAEHASPHVRRNACTALGSFPDRKKEVVSTLTRGTFDVSPSVRVAALIALAKVLPPADGKRTVERFARDEDPVVRAGVAEAAAELSAAHAVPLLDELIRDANPRVCGAAVSGLGRYASPLVRSTLHRLLGHEDNGIRLAAVLALREMPDASDVSPLAVALTSKGDIAPEVAFNALTNLGAIGGDRARALVEASLRHTERHVRRVARRILRDDFGRTDVATPVPASSPVPRVPLPGVDYPRYTTNPMVEVRTTRGSMVFELLPAEAPVHVHNFLELMRADHYDNLIFHRVVPDFVIQGGDYRGDGNGGRTWNGRALPQEFTTRRFVRGSLGMPRNEDPDSGGSQIFVTHRPTPHLDGLYTIFGELRAGGEVLDRIEVGDRILDVRLLP